jgi:regulator of sigma E protease
VTIIIFIAVLLVVVIVHEYGHFIVARKSGMLVEEFGFGLPPRIWSWQKGETKYSINALPIGGFVKIAGENGEEKDIPKDRQFDSKPWYKKSAVLVAGVFLNIVLAFVFFTIAYMIGLPAPTDSGVPKALVVMQNSPAYEAGIRVGDIIESVSMNGGEITPTNTTTIKGILQSDLNTKNSPLTIKFIQNGEEKISIVTPDPDTKTIGLGIEKIEKVKQNLPKAMGSAISQIGSISSSILHTLGALVTGIFAGGFSSLGLMGPVGLAKEVGSAATFGFAYLLAFTAAISVNLAVLNIMPFPALDGGRLLVVILEAIFRRKFSQQVVGIIHAIGFLLLIILMVVLTVSDIRKVL